MKNSVIKFLFLPAWSMIALVIVAGLAMATQDAHAARYDEYPGTDLQVHYVHLTGHGGDNTVNHRNMLIEYEACVTRNTVFGRPASPLSPVGIPTIVYSEDIEIYYSSNRVLTVDQGVAHHINQANCTITATPRNILKLYSAAGRCDIDLNKKEARGVCDEKSHEIAPGKTLSRIASTQAPAIDLNKVPPQMRAQVAAQIERLKQLPQGANGLYGAALTSTGAYKTIAGYMCEHYRADATRTELCVAHPRSPFPIPALGLNGGIPGLLLDAATPPLTLHAQEVRMDLSVSKEIFAIPKGLKATSIRRPADGAGL